MRRKKHLISTALVGQSNAVQYRDLATHSTAHRLVTAQVRLVFTFPPDYRLWIVHRFVAYAYHTRQL